MSRSEILIYQNSDGKFRLDVRLEDESVWLTQAHMAELFGKSKKTISEHIGNVFGEGELVEGSVVRNFRTTAADRKSYDVRHYNLDVIISVGYRVKSPQGTQFRIWATQKWNSLFQNFCSNQLSGTIHAIAPLRLLIWRNSPFSGAIRIIAP